MKGDGPNADEAEEDDADEAARDTEEAQGREAVEDADVDKSDAPAEPETAEPETAEPETAEPETAEPEKPLFAQSWPASPELDRLLAAFERGNYAYVRAEAPKVAERSSDSAVKAAALDLRKRIDPAPVAGILVIVAVGLLVVLAGHYLGKHNPGAPPSVAPASTNAPLQPAPGNR